MSECHLEEEDIDEAYNPKVRWVIPQRLDAMAFVGRDVLAVAHDIYITFFNFKTYSEIVYVANNYKSGDGVDVIAGHKSNVFAFTEKVKHGRIFILSYPSFIILTELTDMEVNRYKGLCMMECDLVMGFSGFPNYILVVWNWRTHQRLISVPTGVVRRSQIYMPSRTHMLVCECWGEGLIVWEVAQCYKKCFIMRRAKEERVGWEVSEPSLVGTCWSSEGQLYAIDADANLYSLLSNGIGMVTNLEWSENLKGPRKPCICAYGSGLLIYGPDDYIRSLKKCESQWKVVWQHSMADEVVRLVGNAAADGAAAYCARGALYRLAGGAGDTLDLRLFAFKQRNITKMHMIAPEYEHLATMDDKGVLCIYETLSANLVCMKYIQGEDISFQASPTEPLLAVFGAVGHNYGLTLLRVDPPHLEKVATACLTHQIVSLVVFSSSGRELVAAAMSAGHIFIYNLSEDYKLSLVRYAELGRGLADCFLMRVGDAMRVFSLVLFSDKYAIGERIICMNAETGKDNKFAGKMQGPYARLLPLGARDTMLAIPHLAAHYHVLRLAADKGTTVSVKMGPIIDSGHEMKQFNGFFNMGALLTYGYDGSVVLRLPDAPLDYELKFPVSHRYEGGVRQAECDVRRRALAHLSANRTVGVVALTAAPAHPPAHTHARDDLLDLSANTIFIISDTDKTYLDVQEDKKVQEEAMDYRQQREEVVRGFVAVQERLVALLEENLREPPLHQLSLSEFNLHLEHKKERLKQAEREREEIRLQTEARIRAQDKVTAWIKRTCWDTMLTPRVKLFAIFSHYQVENYAVLPTQRDRWPELQQVEALRTLEMELDHDLFRPWEEPRLQPSEHSYTH